MSDINLLKPVAVFEQLFERQIRLEDRRNQEHAAISVAVNVLQSCHGSSLVKIGNTEVICGAKVKVLPDAVDAGSVVANVELTSLSNRTIHPNTGITKEAQFLSSALQRLITNSVCPDTAKDLNIYSETSSQQPVGSYVIKLDAVVLHDDGCLLDACTSAALATLLSLSWPQLFSPKEVSGGDGDARESVSKQYRPTVPTRMRTLSVSDWPVTFSFCFVPLTVAQHCGISPLICQPSRRELTLWDTDAGPGYITVSSLSKNVLELSMTNAFLPGLSSKLKPTERSSQVDGLSPWKALLEASSAYALEMKTAIQDALGTASIK
ncbi:unnamed protein product [Echinostoma caproni]|uniref:Ribosomal RNA-processing protein 42 n=1 Tax=Echinostoma caproni TaxID=27848 RepID=A0A183B0J1_9TREM|nr:unnamed protein product [Echinostoma caproni]